MWHEKPAVIIDNGSGHVKAGVADEEVPRCVFPAVVGKPKHAAMMPGSDKKDFYVGEEAMGKRGVLCLSYPIEHGIVKDWSEMEKVWHHTFFDALRINPEDQACVVSEAPMNPKKNRERMVEMLFEKFSCPAAYIVIQAVMSLYSSGRTTGTVVDSGDGVTHTVPVYEGFALPHAIQRLDLAGRDLSEYMIKILHDSGHNMTSSSEKDIVREMKETTCYVCKGDWKTEMQSAKEHPTEFEKIYSLPDGQKVALGSERFRVPEVMFDPMIAGRELPGLHQSIYRCIQDCDIDLRKDLLKNIVLSGGNTMFPGIAERLESELKALAPQKINVKVIANPQRRYLVWMGASILTRLSSFQNLLITKAEYDSVGHYHKTQAPWLPSNSVHLPLPARFTAKVLQAGMTFLLGTAPSLALAPFLDAAEGSVLSMACKSCRAAFDKECLWADLIVKHFEPALQHYCHAASDLDVSQAVGPCQQHDVTSRPGVVGLLEQLREGGARQAYLTLASTNCEPFVLQPRARLILEIHELHDWNRHQRRLLHLRQAESISASLCDHAAGQRLREAIVSESLELIALQAVVAGGGKLARPSTKLQQGVDWNPDMEQSLVKILERRAQQRRNWFRKQREFLLQDLRWEDWSTN
ncbi:actin [Symbiodinium microadriaticum]|uniref:Actin n=1 Tax=Symbiodinium microadriaticum TaxID=2951 RepID=A0A1Q9CIH8_SYMMI|nr:actin [Symbiodinium microadriaticum]